jgi:hypothetical protein
VFGVFVISGVPKIGDIGVTSEKTLSKHLKLELSIVGLIQPSKLGQNT